MMTPMAISPGATLWWSPALAPREAAWTVEECAADSALMPNSLPWSTGYHAKAVFRPWRSFLCRGTGRCGIGQIVQCPCPRHAGSGRAMSSSSMGTAVRTIRLMALLPLLTLLGACNAVELNPSGDEALQQRNLLD